MQGTARMRYQFVAPTAIIVSILDVLAVLRIHLRRLSLAEGTVLAEATSLVTVRLVYSFLSRGVVYCVGDLSRVAVMYARIMPVLLSSDRAR
jgi:hypothetical protein